MSVMPMEIGEVQSAFFDLDDSKVGPMFPQSSLSGQERARAAGYRSSRDRERFVARRAILRFLLSEYLGKRPEAIAFLEAPGGRPFVEAPAGKPPVHFSVSHSQGMAAYAFGIDVRVGIDIERVDRTIEYSQLARQFFTASECAQMAALEQPDQANAFFVCWTRKEAYVKAAGIQPYDSFEIGIAGNEVVDHLRPHEDGRWTVESLDAPEGYKCSLVRRVPPVSPCGASLTCRGGSETL